MCPNSGCIPTASAELVEQAVLSSIEQQLKEIEVSGILNKSPDLSQYDKTIASAESELKRVASQTSQIHTFLETGVYDVDTFLDRRRALEERTAILKDLIRRQQSEKEAAANSDLAAAASKIRDVLQIYWSCDAPQRNTLLRSIVKSVSYYRSPSSNRPSSSPFSVSVTLQHFTQE